MQSQLPLFESETMTQDEPDPPQYPTLDSIISLIDGIENPDNWDNSLIPYAKDAVDDTKAYLQTAIQHLRWCLSVIKQDGVQHRLRDRSKFLEVDAFLSGALEAMANEEAKHD